MKLTEVIISAVAFVGGILIGPCILDEVEAYHERKAKDLNNIKDRLGDVEFDLKGYDNRMDQLEEMIEFTANRLNVTQEIVDDLSCAIKQMEDDKK